MKKILTLCGMLTLCAGTIFSARFFEKEATKLAEKLESAGEKMTGAILLQFLATDLEKLCNSLADFIKLDLAGDVEKIGFYTQYVNQVFDKIKDSPGAAKLVKERLVELVGANDLQAWIEKYTKKIAESAGEQFKEVALEAVNAIAVAPEFEEQIAANFFKQYRKELATLGITTAAGAATFLGIIALLAGSKQDDKPTEEHHPAPSFSDSFEHVVH